MKQITIDCPDEVLVAVGAPLEQFQQEARMALAAKLFELGRLSSGQAARIAGMDRVTFLMSLHRLGVAAVDLTEHEFEDDVRYART